MEFALIIWAIGTLPAIGLGLTLVGASMTVLTLMAWAISEGDLKPKLLYISVPLWLFAALIPNKETAYAMAAGYGVQSVAQDERVQKIAGQGVDVLEQYLAKTKKELEGQVKTQATTGEVKK